MNLFPWIKSKPLFTGEENDRIVKAIRSCETTTSGEVRVFIEAKNPLVDPIERAWEIFLGLQMQATHHRNAVLLYIAFKHKEIALIGDKGIHEKVGLAFWQLEVKKMIDAFQHNDLAGGIVECVLDVGQVLQETFPYQGEEDKNELPDEIVFGKI